MFTWFSALILPPSPSALLPRVGPPCAGLFSRRVFFICFKYSQPDAEVRSNQGCPATQRSDRMNSMAPIIGSRRLGGGLRGPRIATHDSIPVSVGRKSSVRGTVSEYWRRNAMNKIALIIGLALTLSFPAFAEDQMLDGTYNLVSSTRKLLETGDVVDTYGKHPTG
jgi:hypothetical protein